ncbi:uncharacterized protein LOC6585427 [Drosophila mojavensis]|uniref:Putative ionotropic receptor ligand binding domain-containing protein n=1 Tax=Drosophila mojavensis TaxID=7230 RepID=B4L6A4_DROMO|nr:uncharacterized protein LOC6585427 [Drosophila mojavensis]EDW05900.1 uncharacterized protein Dmoj_GI16215 [Drosophila mojavensis]
MLSSESVQSIHNITLIYAVVWTINSHYASDSSKPLSIMNFARRESSRDLHNDLTDAVLRLASAAGRIKFLLQNEGIVTDESLAEDAPQAPPSGVLGRDTGLFLLDSWATYLRLERHLMQPGSFYKRNGYYCIVYTGEETGRLSVIYKIFQRLLAIYVINVNVLLANRQNGTIQVYNYYPYRPHRCQSSEPVHYATFQGSLGAPPIFHLENSVRFFDSKVDDMHGCKLVTVTFQHRPFVIIDDSSNLTDVQRLLGIEGRIYQLLAERMNFAVTLVKEPNGDRGIVHPNGTLTGAMKMIVDGLANITFVSYMYNKERAMYMLPSISYTSFPIVLCVPGGRPLTPLERLTKPLGYITWICLLTSILTGLTLITMLQLLSVPRLRRFVLGESNRRPATELWSTLFGGIHMHPPRRNFARFLLAMWLLETLVLRAAYTGEMYILLQDARVRAPLRTLAEVLDKKFEFHMLPALKPVFRELVSQERVVLIPRLEESLVQLRDNAEAQFVVPLLRPTASRFDMDSGPEKPRLTVLRNPMLTAPMTLYMRPHSYLKQRINKLLINMMSSGLVDRFRRMYLDRIEHIVNLRNREPTKLSLWQLGGLFASFGLMHLLASIVFLLELHAAQPHRPRLRRLMNAANRYMV